MRRRVLSLLLAVVLLFTASCPAMAAPAARSDSLVEGYAQEVRAAADRDSTAQYYRFLRRVRFFFRLLTGQLIFPDKNFNVTLDERLTDYCDYICENANLDIVRILTNLPDSNRPAELLVKTFRIDTAEMRRQLNEKSGEYWGKGNFVLGGVYLFLAKYFSIMDNCEVLSVETDEANVHEVVLRLTYRDGGQEELRPGIFINSVTGEAYNRDGTGLVGTGFNCSIYDLLVYTPVNAWMRNFGFMLFYDLFVYASPDWMWKYETRRFKFDYDGREWMIQIWKGNYLVTNGGEIGIYNREKYRAGTYYDCAKDEDMLDIALTVRHGDDVILSLPRVRHWWRNGFKMGKTLYDPKSLTLEGEIVMRDEAMRDAFCNAIVRNLYNDVAFTTDGLTVYITW